MSTISDKTRTRHVRSISVDNIPAMTVRGWSHQGKQFIPDRVQAAWYEPGQPSDVSIFGTVLKKDGTPGQQRAEMIVYLNPISKHSSQAPEWVLELFEGAAK